MKENLGIFINNTINNKKLDINIINFNNLKNNFDAFIITDVNNRYSKELKNNITNNNLNIISYTLINNDNNSNNILYILNNKNINIFNKYKYITFINDNYIYCNNLLEYFKYIHCHNLDFYSFSDSTEDEYHYNLYLFSIKYNNINIFKTYLESNNDIKFILKLFDKKMSYLKLGYLDTNYQLNIFNNEYLFKFLFEKDILPILSLDKLHNYLSQYSYKYNKFVRIPSNFNFNIYREYEDLKDFSNEELSNHFINYGQYEHRTYTNLNNYIQYVLPDFIRKKIKSLNLLKYFDIPDNFDLYYYKENNNDILNMTEKELILHWIDYGVNENRIYSKK